jgi:hypothetical protein
VNTLSACSSLHPPKSWSLRQTGAVHIDGEGLVERSCKNDPPPRPWRGPPQRTLRLPKAHRVLCVFSRPTPPWRRSPGASERTRRLRQTCAAFSTLKALRQASPRGSGFLRPAGRRSSTGCPEEPADGSGRPGKLARQPHPGALRLCRPRCPELRHLQIPTTSATAPGKEEFTDSLHRRP